MRLRARPMLALAIGVFLVTAASSRGYIDSGDAQGRYAVAWRIWDCGSIFLAGDDPWVLASEIRALTPEGEGISFYGLGQSVTMLPAVVAADLFARLVPCEDPQRLRYLAGQFIFTTATLPLFAALAAVALALLARRLGMSRTVACWAAVALTFGTFWCAYLRTVGMNLEVSLLVLAALVVHSGGAPTAARLALTSACLGATFHYRQEFLIPVVLIIAMLLLHLQRGRRLERRRVFHLLWPCFAFGCLVLLHNAARSGSPFESFPGFFSFYTSGEQSSALAGSAPLTDSGFMFGSVPAQYLPAALFGVTKGLFWYSPLLFLLVLWLLPGARGGHPALGYAAVPVIGFLLFIGSIRWVLFEGSWGPRYLLPVVPFAVLGGACGLAPLLRRRATARALALLVLVACVGQAVLTFEGNNALLEQGRAAAAKLPAESRSPALRSLLLGRLRNLGLDGFDPPEVRAAWSDPEVRALAARTTDQLWWLKLGTLVRSTAVRLLLGAAGLAVLVAGLGALAVSLWPAPLAASGVTAAGRGAEGRHGSRAGRSRHEYNPAATT